jgi:16S rRNA (uracil1498-N3)-methyltransferase
MALRRIYVDWLADDKAGVGGDRAHHLARVVRLKPGEQVEVSDRKRVFEATVGAVSSKEVAFRLDRELAASEASTKLEVALAIIKFPRFEWALEKLTELGVDVVVPVAAERSDRGLIQAAAKRHDRWRAIAEEAAQQSRRLAPPEITGPLALSDALARAADLRIFLDFEAPPLREVAKPYHCAMLLIGPEGGWTDAERQLASGSGALGASFGATVLRAETAAIASAAMLTHILKPRS